MLQTRLMPDVLEIHLREVEQVLVLDYKPDIPVIGQALTSVFGAGGKRLRPSLVLLCHAIFAPPDRRAVQLAACTEAVHVASLLHDDVVDNVATRRGKPSVNAVWGNKVAVMLADFFLTRVLASLSTPENIEAMAVVSHSTSEMAAGQLRELQYQRRYETSEEEYLTLIREKTGALIEASCHIGAVAAAATPEQVEVLDRFGYHLGLAYQIMDDCLDYWGDPARLGKPVGSDLAEGKVTLPLIRTLEACSAEERRDLQEKLADHQLTPEILGRVFELMDHYDIKEKSLNLARIHRDRAREALQTLPAGAARDALAAWAAYTVDREG